MIFMHLVKISLNARAVIAIIMHMALPKKSCGGYDESTG
jgi:hypothetical protein